MRALLGAQPLPTGIECALQRRHSRLKVCDAAAVSRQKSVDVIEPSALRRHQCLQRGNGGIGHTIGPPEVGVELIAIDAAVVVAVGCNSQVPGGQGEGKK